MGAILVAAGITRSWDALIKVASLIRSGNLTLSLLQRRTRRKVKWTLSTAPASKNCKCSPKLPRSSSKFICKKKVQLPNFVKNASRHSWMALTISGWARHENLIKSSRCLCKKSKAWVMALRTKAARIMSVQLQRKLRRGRFLEWRCLIWSERAIKTKTLFKKTANFLGFKVRVLPGANWAKTFFDDHQNNSKNSNSFYYLKFNRIILFTSI